MLDELPSVPFQIVLDQFSIREYIHCSWVSKGWNALFAPELRSKFNLKQFLTCLKNPASMMNVLRNTNSFLSGSRAVAYAVPSIRKHIQKSDWDFYCPFHQRETLHNEILSQGYLPDGSNEESVEPVYRFEVSDYRNTHGHKIQLVALHPEWGAFNCVYDFNTSVVQNLITGYGFYSLRWEATFNRTGWFSCRLAPYEEYREKLRWKWGARGVTVLDWEDRDMKVSAKQEVFSVYFQEAGDVEILQYLNFDSLKADLGLPVDEEETERGDEASQE
jgi:hypothetical protein